MARLDLKILRLWVSLPPLDPQLRLQMSMRALRVSFALRVAANASRCTGILADVAVRRDKRWAPPRFGPGWDYASAELASTAIKLAEQSLIEALSERVMKRHGGPT